jgi:hypothetical protein
MKAGFGFADYLLYLDRKAVGAVEAKPEGTLTGVEAPSAKYAGRPSREPSRAHAPAPVPLRVQRLGHVLHQWSGPGAAQPAGLQLSKTRDARGLDHAPGATARASQGPSSAR